MFIFSITINGTNIYRTTILYYVVYQLACLLSRIVLSTCVCLLTILSAMLFIFSTTIYRTTIYSSTIYRTNIDVVYQHIVQHSIYSTMLFTNYHVYYPELFYL